MIFAETSISWSGRMRCCIIAFLSIEGDRNVVEGSHTTCPMCGGRWRLTNGRWVYHAPRSERIPAGQGR